MEEAMVKAQDEATLMKEMGLHKQVSLRELEKVMDGSEYYRVTDAQLESLFNMRWLRVLAWWANQKSRSMANPWATAMAATCLPISIASLVVLIHGLIKSGGSVQYAIWLIPVIIGGFVGGVACTERDDYWEDKRLRVRLITENIEHTHIKIPFGALLRLKEAKEKKIFDYFVVAYPSVLTENLSRDPAILGVKYGPKTEFTHTRDEDKYMIVFWDLEKEQAKAVRDIKEFGRFKL